MAFQEDFANCLSPLPTPSRIIASCADVASALVEIARAWRAAGGTNDILLQILVAVGAVTGIDEAALLAAGGATVVTYIASCAACAIRVAGPVIWDSINACTDNYVQGALTLAANNAGIGPVVA